MTNSIRSLHALAVTAATRGGALLSVVLLSACGGDSAAPVDDSALEPAYAAISADDIMRHTQVLAHDSLEGRAPATAGEDKTVRYLEEQFKAMGLVGGMPDGSFVQNVTLLRSVPHPEAAFHVGSRVIPLSHPADYYMVTRREQALVEADAELVFVGYGVVAPEYDWDDYKDVDVKGKVLVMLVNDPAIPDATDSTKLDASMFKGSAMTYYGRWTYKYDHSRNRSGRLSVCGAFEPCAREPRHQGTRRQHVAHRLRGLDHAAEGRGTPERCRTELRRTQGRGTTQGFQTRCTRCARTRAVGK
jgi:hypothetical protein